MRKAYLFVYDDQTGTREELKEIFNRMATVKTWRYDLPHCYYLISEDSANQIYKEFETLHGTKGRFMFIEASDNRQGQMLPDTWHLLSNKSHKPKSS